MFLQNRKFNSNDIISGTDFDIGLTIFKGCYGWKNKAPTIKWASSMKGNCLKRMIASSMKIGCPEKSRSKLGKCCGTPCRKNTQGHVNRRWRREERTKTGTPERLMGYTI